MKFFTDYTGVSFSGLDKVFPVYSTFVEFTGPITQKTISIKFYGIIIALGFVLAVILGGRLAYKWKIDLNKMLDVLLWGTISGIIGARLYYVLFEWDYYKNHLSEIPQIHQGGLAIYGGLIFGVLAAYFVCKKENLNFLKLLDMAGMSFLIGQSIGRWGNFTNQEAFGINTSLPWGMHSSKIAEYITEHQEQFAERGISMTASSPVHPTFLYESLWCLVGFIIIYAVCKKAYKFQGELILLYGVIYGTERAVVEGLRTDSLYIGTTNLRISQILSIFVAFMSFTILIIRLVQLKKNPVFYSPVETLPEELDYELPEGRWNGKSRNIKKNAVKRAKKNISSENRKEVAKKKTVAQMQKERQKNKYR
ncbi:MAG: prolipoprotein diacylglyceryl transferase [Candidatus Fimenecus sp.]